MFLIGMAKGNGTSSFSNCEVGPLKLLKVTFIIFFQTQNPLPFSQRVGARDLQPL